MASERWTLDEERECSRCAALLVVHHTLALSRGRIVYGANAACRQCGAAWALDGRGIPDVMRPLIEREGRWALVLSTDATKAEEQALVRLLRRDSALTLREVVQAVERARVGAPLFVGLRPEALRELAELRRHGIRAELRRA